MENNTKQHTIVYIHRNKMRMVHTTNGTPATMSNISRVALVKRKQQQQMNSKNKMAHTTFQNT